MEREFVDYYEVLQVSPNADGETIERVFRHLASRYHPDNPQTGDVERFREIVDAHRLLSDSERRAEYDAHYQSGRAEQWSLVEEAADGETYTLDQSLRERLLCLLYSQRRRDVRNPSLGNVQLENLLSCPHELLDFHMWYLREKKLVERTDRGFAITAHGVDAAETSRTAVDRSRWLGAGSEGAEHGEPAAERLHD